MANSDPIFQRVDPLRESYRSSIAESPEAFKSVRDRSIALLVIDMQKLDAARGIGVFEHANKSGIPIEAQEYYFDRLERIAVPNLKLLQQAFRDRHLEVIHTRIQSLTQDGRDRSAGHKRLGLHAAPGSKEAEFIDGIGPVGDEIVLNKTASGVFSSTNIEYVLRNLGINGLFVAGVYTNECVDTAIRDACDRGFHTTLVEDCCATVTPDLHYATLTSLRDRYARVISTKAAIEEIQATDPPEQISG